MDMLVKQRLDQLTPPRRNHYFYGKLLDELHLQMEQEYVNGKRRTLNRLALGRGVLCGLAVTANGKSVTLSPGVAIDGYGREIVVPGAVPINPSKIGGPCGTVRDRDPATEPKVWLALCYRECKTDFEPALVTDCHPQHACAPSTIVESYCIEVRVGEPPAIEAENEALCEALNGGQDAAEKRELLCEALTNAPCATAGADACVVLATIELAADGTVGEIDCCSVRERIYSNKQLFDLLLCLDRQGQKGDTGEQGPTGETGAQGDAGPKGDTGLGLDPDLPKILDIGWEHDQQYFFYEQLSTKLTEVLVGKFVGSYLPIGSSTLELASSDELLTRLRTGELPPMLTIYFNRPLEGINTHTFGISCRLEIKALGFGIDLEALGQVLTVEFQAQDAGRMTPHTEEEAAFAATFVPSQRFLFILFAIALMQKANADRPATLSISLKGDFIFAPEDGATGERILDADNIAGQVGLARERGGAVRGGKNPSGNLTQGGDFESWVNFLPAERYVSDSEETEVRTMATSMAARMNSGFSVMPISIHLASESELEMAGLSSSQAANIVRERQKGRFASSDDLAKRTRISKAELKRVQDRIILL